MDAVPCDKHSSVCIADPVIRCAVVVLDRLAVAVGTYRAFRDRLSCFDCKHRITQQERDATGCLARDDRLARARRCAGVGRHLGRAFTVRKRRERKPGRLCHILQKHRVAALADIGGRRVDDRTAMLDLDVGTAASGSPTPRFFIAQAMPACPSFFS